MKRDVDPARDELVSRLRDVDAASVRVIGLGDAQSMADAFVAAAEERLQRQLTAEEMDRVAGEWQQVVDLLRARARDRRQMQS